MLAPASSRMYGSTWPQLWGCTAVAQLAGPGSAMALQALKTAQSLLWTCTPQVGRLVVAVSLAVAALVVLVVPSAVAATAVALVAPATAAAALAAPLQAAARPRTATASGARPEVQQSGLPTGLGYTPCFMLTDG